MAGALRGRPRLWPLAALGAAALLVPVVAPPHAPWDLLRHSSLPGRLDGAVVFCGVGRAATVLVFDQGGEWRVTPNRLPAPPIQAPRARPSPDAAAPCPRRPAI